MITGKPPKKPILKQSSSHLSASTKRVSFGGSREGSPGLERSKTLRANIYQNFLQEQENFENLTNQLITIRNVQSAEAALGHDQEDSLSDIEFVKDNKGDISMPRKDFRELLKEKVLENKENFSQNQSGRKIPESERNNQSQRKPEEENKGNLSMELSNSSRLSLPKLLEQSLQSGLQTPMREIKEVPQEDPQVFITTPTGSKVPHENTPGRPRANSNPHSPTQRGYISFTKEDDWNKSANDIKYVEGRPLAFSYAGNPEDLKLSVPESNIQIERPKMEPLLGSGETNRYQYSSVREDEIERASEFEKSKRQIIPEENPENHAKSILEDSRLKESKLVSQKGNEVDHEDEQLLSEIHKEAHHERMTTGDSGYFKDLLAKSIVPKSAILDLATKRSELMHQGQGQNAKSFTLLAGEDLETNLDRLRNLKFDLFKKKDDILKSLQRFKEEGSKAKNTASHLPKDEDEEEKVERESVNRSVSKLERSHDSLILRQLEETERKQREDQEREEQERIEEEKRAKKVEGLILLLQRLEHIVVLRQCEDIKNVFEFIKDDYLEQKYIEKLAKIQQGLTKLDEGVLNERNWLVAGFEGLKEHLKETLIIQNAQDYRKKVLAYNSLMSLRDYALYIRNKLLKEAKAKEHFRHERLRKCFGAVQTHANFCKEWLNSVKAELLMHRKFKIFEAWKADARYEKINRLTDQLLYIKELKLKKRIMWAWNEETMKDIRIPLEKGLKMKKTRLMIRAFKVFKWYRLKRQASKENNMRAYMHLMTSMNRKYFKALIPSYMREQSRKVNVDEFEDYIPLRINIKDKVTKISGKEKEWALLNNEKSVVIDVIKRKGR